MIRPLFLIPAIILIAGCAGAAETPPDQLTLFPEPEVLNSGYLQVSDLHQIYYWTAGNPEGIHNTYIIGQHKERHKKSDEHARQRSACIRAVQPCPDIQRLFRQSGHL